MELENELKTATAELERALAAYKLLPNYENWKQLAELADDPYIIKLVTKR